MPEEKPIPKFLTYEQWKTTFPDESLECDACDGKGKEEVECPHCDGEGYIDQRCSTCSGTGTTNGKEKSRFERQYANDMMRWEQWHKALQEAADAQ
jgi:hypothetical protein